MIFRRLAGALASQDWLVVSIEVMVVVVGIFIGLQVDDWNEARKDRNDEQDFMIRLHEDVLLARELSERVLERRISFMDDLITTADALFARSDVTSLTKIECKSIVAATNFNINVAGLSSVAELMGTGRMDIIQNRELRSALTDLQQIKQTLTNYVFVQTTATAGSEMATLYPELIQLTASVESGTGEIRPRVACDLEKMRNDRVFLNDFSANADRYDAYVRDGLAPWSSQSEKVHSIVDGILGIDHVAEQGE